MARMMSKPVPTPSDLPFRPAADTETQEHPAASEQEPVPETATVAMPMIAYDDKGGATSAQRIDKLPRATVDGLPRKQVIWLSREDLVSHPWNTRGDGEIQDTADLEASIKRQGVVTPIMVTPITGASADVFGLEAVGKLAILSGHRRAAALGKVAPLYFIPAIVVDTSGPVEQARFIGAGNAGGKLPTLGNKALLCQRVVDMSAKIGKAIKLETIMEIVDCGTATASRIRRLLAMPQCIMRAFIAGAPERLIDAVAKVRESGKTTDEVIGNTLMRGVEAQQSGPQIQEALFALMKVEAIDGADEGDGNKEAKKEAAAAKKAALLERAQKSAALIRDALRAEGVEGDTSAAVLPQNDGTVVVNIATLSLFHGAVGTMSALLVGFVGGDEVIPAGLFITIPAVYASDRVMQRSVDRRSE